MTKTDNSYDDIDLGVMSVPDILAQADQHMQAAEYGQAVRAFEAAAEKLSDYDQRLRNAVDDSIQKMALPGCDATPPLPQARHMISLRNKL